MYIALLSLYRGTYPIKGPDKMCRPFTRQAEHDPPLLFNLDYDPGELDSLDTTDYEEILQTIDEVGVIGLLKN